MAVPNGSPGSSCHASQVRYVRGTQNRYADPPFADNGVGCERCHGPGGEHVRNPSAAPMANPAKLDAVRRDSICMQCHLSGLSRVPRAGRRFVDFHLLVPGMMTVKEAHATADGIEAAVATAFPGMEVTVHIEPD